VKEGERGGAGRLGGLNLFLILMFEFKQILNKF
jgi:hypothetical protein